MTYEQLLQDLHTLLIQFKANLISILPNLVFAIIILIIGFFTARILRALVSRFITNLDRFIISKKLKNKIREIQLEQSAKLGGKIIYWFVLIFFLTIATQVLGLPVITTWLSGLVYYLPNIIFAAIIIFLGIIGGKLLGEMISTAAASSSLAYISVLGKIIQYTILFITILIAIDQIGINIDILTNVIDIILAAILLGAALAFGLGAKTSVSNILASHYFKNRYNEGQMIRIGDIEGKIIQITPTAVIVDTLEGTATIPAKKFSENFSILIKSKGTSK